MMIITGLGDSRASLPAGTSTMPTVPVVQTAPASIEDVMATMNAHNDRVFALSLVSTFAVAVSALITVFRTVKLIREDSKS